MEGQGQTDGTCRPHPSIGNRAHKQFKLSSNRQFNEKGVPLQRLMLPMPTKKQWIDRRKTFLTGLNPAARNLLLTGDPAFTIDPVIYEFVMASDPLYVPMLVQQQLGYLSPSPSPLVLIATHPT